MFKATLRTSVDHREWEEMKKRFLSGEKTMAGEQQGIRIEEITERVPITAIDPIVAKEKKAKEEDEEEENLVLDFPHFPARTKGREKR